MPRYSLGLAATSYLSVWQSIDTLEFLEHAHRFGAAGIHAVINNDPEKIRARAEQFEMYVEAMVPLPSNGSTVQLEQSLKDAKAAGASALRAACLGTRRYETFKTKEAWQAHVAASRRSLDAAVPMLDKFKIPLGLENHKDWRSDEFLELLRQYSSEYFGVCLDFGNNISLMERPMETIEALAPFTVSTHVKDIAVGACEGGFLLLEVVLGQGLIDLKQAVTWIRQARPATRFSLEMITRSPLIIPMIGDDYLETFTHEQARDRDSVMQYIAESAAAMKFPGDEDQNIADCLTAWEVMELASD